MITTLHNTLDHQTVLRYPHHEVQHRISLLSYYHKLCKCKFNLRVILNLILFYERRCDWHMIVYWVLFVLLSSPFLCKTKRLGFCFHELCTNNYLLVICIILMERSEYQWNYAFTKVKISKCIICLRQSQRVTYLRTEILKYQSSIQVSHKEQYFSKQRLNILFVILFPYLIIIQSHLYGL